MYEILARIYSGEQLVKYEVLDSHTNGKKRMSIDMVHGLAIAGVVKNVKYNEQSRSLVGIEGFDIESLPKKKDRVRKDIDGISRYLTGKELRAFIESATEVYERERYLVDDLMKFLELPCRGKICALYGLRRTGKTIMMYQAIKKLFHVGITDVAYISLTENDSLSRLFKNIESFVKKGVQYIFIDEVTAVNGFIQSSASLADKYAQMGIHIVIAGTDSYVINIAGQNNLYDRMHKIHTSYIGFKEYEYLYPGADILDYIHVGGVLPADIFYDETKTRDYINTAISRNIINSLIRSNNRKQFQRLMELDNRGLLSKAIEQAIESANEELTIDVITKSYTNNTLGSAKQLLEYLFEIDDTLDTEEVEDRIRYRLSVVRDFDAQISDEYVEELKDFLIDIGAIKMYYRYVCSKRRSKKVEVPIFVQPGMRYHQTVALIDALCETPSFYEIPKDVRNQFKEKIIEDVEGNLIEHEVILSELMQYAEKDIEVTQLIYESKEIDMIIHNSSTLYLFEIKRNANALDEQAKWLVNKEICDYMETYFNCKINKKVVLYLGKDMTRVVEGEEIYFQNINSFLLQAKNMKET